MSVNQDDDKEQEIGTLEQGEPSEIAVRLAKLKSATFAAAESRERLPQPLFWSLFHSTLSDLKKQKSLAEKIKEILGK